MEKKSVHFSLICARHSILSGPHRLLLDKLKTSGLNEHLIKWTFSYLYSREQYVVLNGAESSKIPVLSGVPQGSVLGPLLFLAYINDSTLEPLDHDTHITLYADDILLYRTITAPSDYEILQSDIYKYPFQSGLKQQFNSQSQQM